MSRKAAKKRVCAQLTESLVLVLAAAWITLLTPGENQFKHVADRRPQVNMVSHVLLNLQILVGLAVLHSLVHPTVIYKSLQLLCRRERDTGLVVGCVLPPLVLLSRLFHEIYQKGTYSSFTFFYMWVTVSIGYSVLLKIAVFKSVIKIRIGAFVDVVLLPLIFTLLNPVESTGRFLLATGARISVAAVLAAGLQLLPRSFTIGEAILVAQGVGLCAFDLVLVTIIKVRFCIFAFSSVRRSEPCFFGLAL